MAGFLPSMSSLRLLLLLDHLPESLERERAEPAVALLGASACASDALGKCRLAVWVGEGETRRPDAAAKGILKGQARLSFKEQQREKRRTSQGPVLEWS